MRARTTQRDSETSLSLNATETLRERYLRKDGEGRVVETPEQLFHRVANVVASAEKKYGARPEQARTVEQMFFDAMARGVFLPNSPTLMNAGRQLGMLSACFVLPVDDSIEGIFESIKNTAQIQKAGGGTGFAFDRLRPTGDMIKSSGGRTSGPISFWRVFCEATRAIQQGAFRRGANMGMMNIDHPDILKFITAKNDLNAFENFNISVKVTDGFLRQLSADPGRAHVVRNPRTGRQYCLPKTLNIADYTLDDLVGPSEASDCYSRRDVWRMIVQGAWATGEPGLCFIDRINADNPTPHLGRIEATNPCGEQPLLDYEACNLGSIDLSKLTRTGKLQEAALRKILRLGVRFLDDVIDVNNYQIEPIARMCKGNRKIGLGIMGLADAMFDLGIKYDSEEGIEFGRRIGKLIRDEAFAASEALGAERGVFPNWPGSTWAQRGRKMRNAAVTTIAPTGTLSILADCSGGIEPVYALGFVRHVLDGKELVEINGPFRRYAECNGFWSEKLADRLVAGAALSQIEGIDERAKRLFVTAHEIAPAWHVRMQAAFQESIDGAISKTINLPHEATPDDVEEIYRLAYELKCKGVTVYRDGCRSGQPMAPGRGGPDCPQCGRSVATAEGCMRCPHCGAALCAM